MIKFHGYQLIVFTVRHPNLLLVLGEIQHPEAGSEYLVQGFLAETVTGPTPLKIASRETLPLPNGASIPGKSAHCCWGPRLIHTTYTEGSGGAPGARYFYLQL